MATVTPPPHEQQQYNQTETTAAPAASHVVNHQQQDADQSLPLWLTFIDKWLHNRIILLSLLAAFLATLTTLVLIAGLAGAGLAVLLAGGTLPVARSVHNHVRTPKLESTQTTLTDTSNSEPPVDAPLDEQ